MVSNLFTYTCHARTLLLKSPLSKLLMTHIQTEQNPTKGREQHGSSPVSKPHRFNQQSSNTTIKRLNQTSPRALRRRCNRRLITPINDGCVFEGQTCVFTLLFLISVLVQSGLRMTRTPLVLKSCQSQHCRHKLQCISVYVSIQSSKLVVFVHKVIISR